MQFLLDSHIPASLAEQLQRHGVDAVALRNWKGGKYIDAPDDYILSAAHSDRCTLVTYDCRTIPQIVREWMETGRHHGGIILVDDRTIRPRDIGRLLRALLELIETSSGENWEDTVIYLQAR